MRRMFASSCYKQELSGVGPLLVKWSLGEGLSPLCIAVGTGFMLTVRHPHSFDQLSADYLTLFREDSFCNGDQYFANLAAPKM